MRSDQWEISFNTLVETTQWMIWEYGWFLHARTHFACRKYSCPEFSCLTSLRLLAAVLSPRIPLIRCEDSVGNGGWRRRVQARNPGASFARLSPAPATRSIKARLKEHWSHPPYENNGVMICPALILCGRPWRSVIVLSGSIPRAVKMVAPRSAGYQPRVAG